MLTYEELAKALQDCLRAPELYVIRKGPDVQRPLVCVPRHIIEVAIEKMSAEGRLRERLAERHYLMGTGEWDLDEDWCKELQGKINALVARTR